MQKLSVMISLMMEFEMMMQPQTFNFLKHYFDKLHKSDFLNSM